MASPGILRFRVIGQAQRQGAASVGFVFIDVIGAGHMKAQLIGFDNHHSGRGSLEADLGIGNDAHRRTADDGWLRSDNHSQTFIKCGMVNIRGAECQHQMGMVKLAGGHRPAGHLLPIADGRFLSAACDADLHLGLLPADQQAVSNL